MHYFRSIHPSVIAALLITSALGCGDDANTDAGDDGAGTDETADTNTDGEESSTNGTSDDATDGSDGTDSSEAESTATEGETTEGTDDEATDGTDSGVDCSMFLDRIACFEAGCHPVSGQPLEGGGNGQAACLGEPEFLECIAEVGCDDTPTWFCMGNAMYLVGDSCGPTGYDTCDGPPNAMECP